jgi:tRNA-intron endonuclease
MFELKWDPKVGIWTETDEGIQKLHQNFFGVLGKGKVFLYPEEALYAMNFLNATCVRGGERVGFNDVASHYIKEDPRLFIKYNAYRDWRDRGLVTRRIESSDVHVDKTKHAFRKYPSKEFRHAKYKVKAFWYSEALFSIIEDQTAASELFNQYWFGQYGVYRQERGHMLKLDFLETVFLAKHMALNVIDARSGKQISHSSILSGVVKKREYAKGLYEVYEEWRLKGYIVKTGFKFGSHFRIYFPGAAPTKGMASASSEQWIHSKHVLHVFPKEEKLLISEWARAVRVAHGVKKTFLLSMPKLRREDYVNYPSDFVAWRRKKEGGNLVRETPADKPRYLLVPVSEDEHIGGIELASLLMKASDLGLSLLLSITDRETAITYYVLNKIELPGSKNEYYEIEWMKP